MAGIGFALRGLLASRTLTGTLRAYGYASAISSGPWLLSIGTILAIGVLGRGGPRPYAEVVQFQVSVTYLIALSLVLTGGLQLSLSRLCADRLFAGDEGSVLPNLLGALLAVSGAAGLLGAALSLLVPGDLPLRALLAACFTTLADIWVVVVVLSSLKAYRQVLLAFALGYGVTLGLALGLRPFGLAGLLAGLLAGQALLLFALLSAVARRYPPDGARPLVALDFARRGGFHPVLAATGLVYNLAIWIDKFLFWANPATSAPVLGPLRSSLIYDIPIFLAYVSIVPGMGVFLVRMETDFVEHYDAFYQAVRRGGTLDEIERRKAGMVEAVRQGLSEIFQVQGTAVVALLLFADALLRALGISPLHARLFSIDLAGAGLQVLLLAVLNVFFYLDLRWLSLALSLLFLVANAGLTLLTQHLGLRFYGYGFAGAALVATLTGLALLSRRLERLEYETFMGQPLA